MASLERESNHLHCLSLKVALIVLTRIKGWFAFSLFWFLDNFFWIQTHHLIFICNPFLCNWQVNCGCILCASEVPVYFCKFCCTCHTGHWWPRAHFSRDWPEASCSWTLFHKCHNSVFPGVHESLACVSSAIWKSCCKCCKDILLQHSYGSWPCACSISSH